ncbi:MAG: hypothetical protein LGB07_00995 [Sulfurovum sp.]|nr:hypothetical protein [Sulfurovum sp.]MCB4744224.1 hypothetical protein [Sulfurovum sp.]MCB4747125.1 hypothetical protein [Sulfurovum sp.]MCB4751090.1 hypothetical protein [Sulfurovum sp.]MCB4755294.1 hypothetical protein [Sulfurovum sp.]
MKTIKFTIIGLVMVLTGCAMNSAPPTLTPLEIQSLQTREYKQGKGIVFSSVLSVFQDLGYTVRSADKDTGLITAESAANSDVASMFLLGISNVSQTSATAFVEKIGKITKVRLNFVTRNKISYDGGQSDRQDTPILDARVYQNAFERIENAIFVRSAN